MAGSTGCPGGIAFGMAAPEGGGGSCGGICAIGTLDTGMAIGGIRLYPGHGMGGGGIGAKVLKSLPLSFPLNCGFPFPFPRPRPRGVFAPVERWLVADEDLEEVRCAGC